LNGATAMPRRASVRHNPVTTSDLPASEEVPAISKPLDEPVSVLTGEVYGVSADRSAACRIRSDCVWLGAAVIKS
jgi:hypothetical protein